MAYAILSQVARLESKGAIAGALEPLTPTELSNSFSALRLKLPEYFRAVEK